MLTHDLLVTQGEQRCILEKTLQDSSVDVQQVFEIKRQINSLSPISRIPPELVSTILRASRRSSGLIRLTHIFHYWRSVALSTPTLWDNISVQTGRRELLILWLERAQKVPLTVVSYNLWNNLPIEEPVARCNIVLQELDHIRELTIHLPAHAMAQLEWPSIHPACLKVLFLSTPDDIWSVQLPPKIRDRLRAFPLDQLDLDLMIHWGGANLPQSLKELTMPYRYLDFPYCTLDQVLADLGRLPLLQSLDITLPCFLDDILPSTEILDLPHLRSVYLTGPIDSVIALVNHMKLSASCAVEICVDCYPYYSQLPSDSEWGTLLAAFLNGTRFGQSPPAPMTYCSMQFNRNCFSFACRRGRGLLSEDLTDQVRTILPISAEAFPQLISFCQSMSVQETKQLSISRWFCERDRQLERFWTVFIYLEFRNLPFLHIDMSGSTTEDSQRMLKTLLLFQMPSIDGVEGCRIIFPALHTLVITGVQLDGYYIQYRKGRELYKTKFVKYLAKLLRKRKKLGYGVSLVVTEPCDMVRKEHMRLLHASLEPN